MRIFLQQALESPHRVAVVDTEGAHSYGSLLGRSQRLATALLQAHAIPQAQANSRTDRNDVERQDEAGLAGARVALLAEPGNRWVAGLWGIWQAGGVALPLALNHPPRELSYAIENCGARLALVTPAQHDKLRPAAEALGVTLLSLDHGLPTGQHRGPAADPAAETPSPEAIASLPASSPPEQGALIVYTSGTTGRPKGAVLSHANLQAQVRCLQVAWDWSEEDRILEVLPLHHVHGIVNVMLCALGSGASIEVLWPFDARGVWAALGDRRPTLFMAVPTIYQRLLQAWEAMESREQNCSRESAERLRLMVSGSAALPVTLLEAWEAATGHRLLERYGMTEIGMALSNPLHGERRPGSVGQPLPGVDLRLVDETGQPVAAGQPGQLEVRGPCVFAGYWQQPEANERSFRDGYFRTGDVAVQEQGAYRLLGRESVDILKSGGEKISALEIEAVLREHPAVADCAVVGVPDPAWGQRVAAGLVLRPGHHLELEELRTWGRQHLAPYKLPRQLLLLADLPRNALGKVLKPSLAKQMADQGQSTSP